MTAVFLGESGDPGNPTPFEREKHPYRAILPKKKTPTTGRLVKYAGAAAAVRAAAPRPPAGIAGRDGMSRPPLRCPEAAGCRAPNRSRDGPRPEALFLEKSLFFNGVRRHPASG